MFPSRFLYGFATILDESAACIAIAFPNPFSEGFDAERDASPEAEIPRVFYLLYEMQKYVFICRVRRNRPEEAERYCSDFLEIASLLS